MAKESLLELSSRDPMAAASMATLLHGLANQQNLSSLSPTALGPLQVCACMYVCICVRVYVQMYVCMYVCMCICICICMYTHTHAPHALWWAWDVACVRA